MLKRFFNSPYLLITIVGLYPALFFASNNWFMYQKDQLITLISFSPIFTFIIGIVTYSILYGIMKGAAYFWSYGRSLSWLLEFKTAIFIIYSCAVLFFLFQSVHREIITNTYIVLFVVSLITFIIWMGVRKVGFAFINFPLVVVALISCFQWSISYLTSIDKMYNSLWYTQDKAQNDEINFTAKPNVYLIILEAYHNNSTLKEVYNFDNNEMDKKITKKGFMLYEDVFSNYPTTLTSLVTLFTMQHHYYKISAGKDDAFGAREIIGGRSYNPTLSVFKNNGYNIQFISHSDYAYIAGTTIDYAYPKRIIFKVFEIYQSDLLDDIFSRLFHSYRGKAGKKKNKDRIHVSKEQAYAEMKTRIRIAVNSDKPYLTVIKLSNPGHFGKSWNKIITTSWYPEKIKEANDEIDKLIDHILKTDPDPFIILIADHGAHRYRNVWKGKKSIHETLKSRNISEVTVARDLFATFLAIKYPFANKPKFEIYSHANLFRYIFSVLCQCDLPFETRVADESYLRYNNKATELFITTRNGNPLNRWKILDTHVSDP